MSPVFANPSIVDAVQAIRICTFVEGLYCRPRFGKGKWLKTGLCPAPTGFWKVGKEEGEYVPTPEDLMSEWEVITVEGLNHEEPF